MKPAAAQKTFGKFSEKSEKESELFRFQNVGETCEKQKPEVSKPEFSEKIFKDLVGTIAESNSETISIGIALVGEYDLHIGCAPTEKRFTRSYHQKFSSIASNFV